MQGFEVADIRCSNKLRNYIVSRLGASDKYLPKDIMGKRVGLQMYVGCTWAGTTPGYFHLYFITSKFRPLSTGPIVPVNEINLKSTDSVGGAGDHLPAIYIIIYGMVSKERP